MVGWGGGGGNCRCADSGVACCGSGCAVAGACLAALQKTTPGTASLRASTWGAGSAARLHARLLSHSSVERKIESHLAGDAACPVEALAETSGRRPYSCGRQQGQSEARAQSELKFVTCSMRAVTRARPPDSVVQRQGCEKQAQALAVATYFMR